MQQLRADPMHARGVDPSCGAVLSPLLSSGPVLRCSPLPPALAPLLTQPLAHVLDKLQRIFHPAAACLRAALECGSGLGPGLEGLAAQIGTGSGFGGDWGLGAPSGADVVDEDSGEQAGRTHQPPGFCVSQTFSTRRSAVTH